MIYLDNAATMVHKPQCVMDAVMKAMTSMGNAGRGAHEASLDASRMIYDTRERLARLFGADGPEQVVFTANSTESLNIAIQGLLNPGDYVITTQMEHNSVLRPLYVMEKRGVELTILTADRLGNISYEEMEAAAREWSQENCGNVRYGNDRAVSSRTGVIICTHASNLTGNVNDLERIGSICRRYGLLFIVDASQTAGIFPVDMKQMGIDVLCFTGHKSLMGPQGTGGLCVRKGLAVRPLLVGGSGVQSYSKTHPEEMPTALEAGTRNGHGIAGLHAALEFLEEQGAENLRKKELELMWKFYEGVSQVPGVTVYGDFSSRKRLRAPIVALNIRDYDSGEVADELAENYGILTRAGAHCAPLMHQALGTAEQGAVRFSFSHGNTEEEVHEAIRAVRELAAEETQDYVVGIQTETAPVTAAEEDKTR